MKNLKTYRLFESQQELTQEQRSWLDECTSGTWSVNLQTGLVDVKGDFDCRSEGSDFKGVRFGDIDGDFMCSHNSLTSLEGAPQRVSGSFYCSRNLLTSLEGAPQEVGGYLHCSGNPISVNAITNVIKDE